jgi:hypothetical protein
MNLNKSEIETAVPQFFASLAALREIRFDVLILLKGNPQQQHHAKLQRTPGTFQKQKLGYALFGNSLISLTA